MRLDMCVAARMASPHNVGLAEAAVIMVRTIGINLPIARSATPF